MAWNFIDPLFGKADQKSGMPVPKWICRVTAPLFERFMRNPADSFVCVVVLFVGTFVPAMFFAALWYTNAHGFSLTMAWAYNVLRIGPYFMNFAYVYTLCHKEGHSQLGEA